MLVVVSIVVLLDLTYPFSGDLAIDPGRSGLEALSSDLEAAVTLALGALGEPTDDQGE